eukprot:jgi/Tetstr1/434771/TSEL_023822.t1
MREAFIDQFKLFTAMALADATAMLSRYLNINRHPMFLAGTLCRPCKPDAGSHPRFPTPRQPGGRKPRHADGTVVAQPLAGTAASPELHGFVGMLKAGGIIKHNTNAVKNPAATQALPGDNADKGSSPESPAKKAKQPANPAAGVPARGRGGAKASMAGSGPFGSRAGRYRSGWHWPLPPPAISRPAGVAVPAGETGCK